MEGWVNLGGWLYAEVVYLSINGHPSRNTARFEPLAEIIIVE